MTDHEAVRHLWSRHSLSFVLAGVLAYQLAMFACLANVACR